LNQPALPQVLVSACLLGQPVRYDGGHRLCDHPVLQRWQQEGRVQPFCPEAAGGFGTPRPAAEIVRLGAHSEPAGGAHVLQGQAAVMDNTGTDVSAGFVAGAQAALARAQQLGIRVAVLKDGSPSCGSGFIYDGSFSGATLAGQVGVTTALLREHGVAVFSESQLLEADACLQALPLSAANRR
jgi:uncharacterized protein YbbK (DUF523 family)